MKTGTKPCHFSRVLKWGWRGLLLLAVAATVVVLVLKSRAPYYIGPPSDHYDGKRFFNEISDHRFWDEVKWLWEMETVEWPEWVVDAPQSPPPEAVGYGELRVTFINQATVLLQMDRINILTDPIWSDRAGPLSWLGAPRVRAPGVEFDALPRIDIVLLSHDHYDHLDVPTLQRLKQRDAPLIIAGLGLKNLLAAEGFSNVVELDWWQEYRPDSAGVRYTFVPALHNSGRGLFRDNQILWGGFVISGRAGRIYFAGDTGFGPFIERIHEKFDCFRLVILPIGSYEKRWFMKNQHMNPEDAVMAHALLNSGQSMGMHYATFLEHPEQAIDTHEHDLQQALEQHAIPKSAFWILQFGEGRSISP